MSEELTSFNFVVLPGQTLSYAGSTHTPPFTTAYAVNVTEQAISNEVIQDWLRQSLTPLVGPEAVKFLEQFTSLPEAQQFFDLVRGFRQTLR